MPDKPTPNQSDTESAPPPADQPTPTTGPYVGRDHITAHDVGAGASIGSGSVSAENIAGHDLTISNGAQRREEETRFAEEMGHLRGLIVKAYKAGELSEATARKALANLEETGKLIAQERKPPRIEIVRRLQYIADILDAAADFLSSSGGVAKVVLQALPVAALLIKLASRLF